MAVHEKPFSEHCLDDGLRFTIHYPYICDDCGIEFSCSLPPDEARCSYCGGFGKRDLTLVKR